VLAAAQRLRRREEFAATIRAGRRAGRGAVVVHLHRDTTPARTSVRAGFVVPKAVGNAVTRNKVRRRLRELVRARLADLPPGTDVVVRALPGAADRGFHELGDELDGALAAASTRRSRRSS
jgi:ribonuclease P protein component